MRAGKKVKKSISGTILLVLIIVCATSALLLSGVKIATGRSLPAIIASMFGNDNKVTTGEAPEPDDKDMPTVALAEGRRKGVYNILLAGINAKTGNNSDVVMVVNFDTAAGKVNVVQVPRDTYVNIEGRSFHKINSYYTACYNLGVSEGKNRVDCIDAGMDAFSSFVGESLGIPIDRWVYMDLDGFADIVDAFGGVEVVIPFDMQYSDPEQELEIDLKAGRSLLTGKEAEQFIRFRSGYYNSDYGRMDAQKLFLTALISKIKNGTLDSLLALLPKINGKISTSMTGAEFLWFAGKAYGVSLDGITFATLPAAGVYSNGAAQWYEVINRSGAVKVVGTFLSVFESFDADRVFDAGHRFCLESDPSIMTAYNAISGADPGNAKTATEVASGGLVIKEKVITK